MQHARANNSPAVAETHGPFAIAAAPEPPWVPATTGTVQSVLGQDPFCGTVFVFRSKRADRVKMLVYDGTGLVLIWKRLDGAKFKWPAISDGVMRLSGAQLAALFEGLDWRRVHALRIARPKIAG